MTKRDRFLEFQVGSFLITLRPMLVGFAFHHRRLSNCHPEDYEMVRHLEREASKRMIDFLNRHELLPQFTVPQIEEMVLEWFQKVALKEMPHLERELKSLIDLENYPSIEPYKGLAPSVPEEELADGYGFTWGLRSAGP